MGGWNFTGITVCKKGVAYWVGGTSLVLLSVRRCGSCGWVASFPGSSGGESRAWYTLFAHAREFTQQGK